MGHYPPGASVLAADMEMEMEMDTTTTPPAEIRVSEQTAAQKRRLSISVTTCNTTCRVVCPPGTAVTAPLRTSVGPVGGRYVQLQILV